MAQVGTNPCGLNNIAFDLNLAAIDAGTGNFTSSVTISKAVLGTSDHDQIQLNASFADSTIFDDVYDNGGPDPEVHVWDDGVDNPFGVSTNTGTFEITRTGSTLSGYWGSTLIYSEINSSALTDLNFVLQNNASSNDDISLVFSNFSFTPGNPAPEPASMCLIGAGSVALVRRCRG